MYVDSVGLSGLVSWVVVDIMETAEIYGQTRLIYGVKIALLLFGPLEICVKLSWFAKRELTFCTEVAADRCRSSRDLRDHFIIMQIYYLWVRSLKYSV